MGFTLIGAYGDDGQDDVPWSSIAEPAMPLAVHPVSLDYDVLAAPVAPVRARLRLRAACHVGCSPPARLRPRSVR